ncbi:MAG: isoleucine--tRNA ligase [Nanoarchaeota archaeon]|nr:isoleucine--tRNA ligase [Nanoarchaeota archaeon]
MYEFKKVEELVLKHWTTNNIYKKATEKGKNGKKFYFLQGPPYTSGKLHIAHAWNNSLKDMVMRYKRMKGFDVWDRAGYDMHGLPTARKLMEKHGFKTKEEILEYGMEKFINECIEWSKENAQMMNKDLWRLGIWMDYENAYWPIRNEYIEGVWFLIKKAFEKKRLYEGLRTMSWCPNCATAMAKHECEYKVVKEDSIFVKFKVKNKKKEFILVWTTTPWTMAYNLAVMVNPSLDYVRAKVGDEVWIVAKGLVAPVVNTLSNKGYKILEEFKGDSLEGLEYEHPWHKEIKQFKQLKKGHPKIHTILLSEEYVNLSAGTGLVHTAPGCGPEDYEVGHKNNVPPFNNLKEDGTFPDDMAMFAGLKAKQDDEFFIDELKKCDALLGVTEVEHDYAHCERCHEPVVFRATKQWFFKTEDLKEKMLAANKKICWVPETGKNAFDSWLNNLRDNSITKQRFWGTPIPLWKCDKCGEVVVVASKEELIKLNAKNIPENLHKPWIDDVVIPCKCGADMKRLPDVLDVWIDAGCASWICLGFPHEVDAFEKYFPADFILEAREQIRGWFNLLMVASFLAMDKPCFENVYMHGMLTDIEGQKMSKSLGNVISPYKLIDKYGADTLRFYMCRTNAGEDIKFSWEEAKLRYKNLSILWNVHNYLIEYAKLIGINPKNVKIKKSVEEKFILSRLNNVIKKVTENHEAYKLDDVPKLIEDLFLELSRTYIQLTRDKVNDEPENVLGTIFDVLTGILKMLSTVAPFATEKMFLNLKDAFGLKGESIHLLDWPDFDAKLIDEEFEEDFGIVQNVVQSILSAREKASISVRWPLAEANILTKNKKVKMAVEELRDLIKFQTNVKKVVIKSEMQGVTEDISTNKGQIGKDFKKDSPFILSNLTSEILKEINNKGKVAVGDFELGKEHINVKENLPQNLVSSEFKFGNVCIDISLNDELEKEGYARELSRRVQQLRKDKSLKKSDLIELMIVSDYDISDLSEEIKTKVGVSALFFEDKKFTIIEDFEIKNKKFKIGFKKA